MYKSKLKIINLLFYSLLFSYNNYSQKIESDGFKCSFKEIHTENLRTCSEVNTIFKGIIIVKSKNELNGSYPFYFASMGDNKSILTLKNNENKDLSPTLLFDELKREFYYDKGEKNEQKIFIADEKTEKEVILEGMIFWLRIKSSEINSNNNVQGDKP